MLVPLRKSSYTVTRVEATLESSTPKPPVFFTLRKTAPEANCFFVAFRALYFVPVCAGTVFFVPLSSVRSVLNLRYSSAHLSALIVSALSFSESIFLSRISFRLRFLGVLRASILSAHCVESPIFLRAPQRTPRLCVIFFRVDFLVLYFVPFLPSPRFALPPCYPRAAALPSIHPR